MGFAGVIDEAMTSCQIIGIAIRNIGVIVGVTVSCNGKHQCGEQQNTYSEHILRSFRPHPDPPQVKGLCLIDSPLINYCHDPLTSTCLVEKVVPYAHVVLGG